MSGFQDAFIAYANSDSGPLVTQLSQKLASAGLTVTLAADSNPGDAPEMPSLEREIQRAHNILVVISPASMTTSHCLETLRVATHYHKRVVPILPIGSSTVLSKLGFQTRDMLTQWPTEVWTALQAQYPNLPSDLKRLTWVLLPQEGDRLEASIGDVLTLLQQDSGYIHCHTQLLLSALRWRQQQQNPQYLLLGADLEQAEQWLKSPLQGADLPSRATDLHCEYIAESIRNIHNLTNQVFLAHAPDDRDLADQVRLGLNRQAITVWTPSHRLGDADLWLADQQAVIRGIEGADTVVALVSAASVEWSTGQDILKVATRYRKRIILLLCDSVDREHLPAELRESPAVQLSADVGTPEFEQGLAALVQAIQQDAAYFTTHKNLLLKALKWERQNHNPCVLLKGHSLRQAEAWFQVATRREQFGPVPLQKQFLAASQQQPPDFGLDVFISYSRANADFARRLNEGLQVHGKSTWFDQESIAGGTDFQEEIYNGIESCDNFLFILSAYSIESAYCKDELAYALQHHKRVIPVLYDDIEPLRLPETIATIQWIDFSHHPNFYISLGELIRTMDTDRDHVRNHTRWLRRATEWAQAGRSQDLLLRGNECALADNWLQEARQGAKSPAPLPLHHEWIEASRRVLRQELERERRQTATLRSLLTIVAAAYSHAEDQRQRAEVVQEGQIRALVRYSQALLAAHQHLEAKVEAIRAGRQLQQQMTRTEVSIALEQQVTGALQTALTEGHEANQLAGHSQGITAVAWSPDGSVLATASLDRTVRLWTAKGVLLQTLTGHGDGIYGLCFSPDGFTLASAGADRTIRLWNMATGDAAVVLAGHDDWVYSVQFRPDGQGLASCSVDCTVKLWTLDGYVVQSIQHPDTIVDLCFSPDGSRLASACVDHKIRLWDLQGTLLDTWEGHTGAVTAVAFNGTGDRLASASFDRTLRLWDVASGTSQVLQGHQDDIWQVKFGPDDAYLVSTSSDKTIKFWSPSGHVLLTLQGHRDTVSALALHPTESIAMSGSYDKTIRLWRYSWPQVSILEVDTAGVEDIALLAKASLQDDSLPAQGEGRKTTAAALPGDDDHNSRPELNPVSCLDSQMAIAATSGTVSLWQPDGSPCRSWQAHPAAIKGIAASSDGRLLATAGIDTTVKLWRPSGEWVQTLEGHTLPVRQVVFSPDCRWLASASYDKTVRVWTAEGVHRYTLQGHTDQVWDVAFAPNVPADEIILATVGWDKTLRLWRARTELAPGQSYPPEALTISPWRVIEGHEDVVSALAFSHAGDCIATASQDRTVKVWAPTGQLHLTLGHEQSVTAVCFSEDDRWIATGGCDRTITLWNRQGQRLLSLTGHTNTIWQLRFQGKRLLSASEDGTVRLWTLNIEQLESLSELHSLSLEKLLDQGCSQVQDYLQNNLGLGNSDRGICFPPQG
jgi:WD40 repeat protein